MIAAQKIFRSGIDFLIIITALALSAPFFLVIVAPFLGGI
jgi:hypothetical protein